MRKGFTLVELLISLAIFSIVMGLLFGGLIISISARERAREKAEIYLAGYSLVKAFTEEIESMYSFGDTAGLILEEGGYFGLTFDRFVLTTLAKGKHNEVEYFIEPDTETEVGILKKRVDARIDANLGVGGTTLAVLRNVVLFDVRFLGKTGWQERWSLQDGTPKAVEVKFEVKFGNMTIPFYVLARPMMKIKIHQVKLK